MLRTSEGLIGLLELLVRRSGWISGILWTFQAIWQSVGLNNWWNFGINKQLLPNGFSLSKRAYNWDSVIEYPWGWGMIICVLNAELDVGTNSTSHGKIFWLVSWICAVHLFWHFWISLWYSVLSTILFRTAYKNWDLETMVCSVFAATWAWEEFGPNSCRMLQGFFFYPCFLPFQWSHCSSLVKNHNNEY